MLFLAQTVVSCSEILGAREGGCQGAPGLGHRVLFESRGSLFFEHFFKFLSLKIVIFYIKAVLKLNQNESMWSLFLRKKCKNEKMCFDCEGVCRLPRATPKSKEKHDMFQDLLV